MKRQPPKYITEDGYPMCQHHMDELLKNDEEWGMRPIRPSELSQGCFGCNEELGTESAEEDSA